MSKLESIAFFYKSNYLNSGLNNNYTSNVLKVVKSLLGIHQYYYYFKLVTRISVGHPILLDAILNPSFANERLFERT